METGTHETSVNNSFNEACSTKADADVFLSAVQANVFLRI